MTWPEADFPVFGEWRAPGAPQGALVFPRDAEGRVLMQLRDDRPGVAQAGLWGAFGGGVEDGETLAEAALRELLEETGLRLTEADLRPVGRAVSNTARRTRLYAFAAPLRLEAGAIRLGEGAGFALLTPRQVRTWPVAWPLRAMALRVAEGA